MSKGKLFEYAILHHPKKTKAQVETGEDAKSVIVSEPKFMLAGTDNEVSVRAAREIPDKYLDKLEDVEILVRPF